MADEVPGYSEALIREHTLQLGRLNRLVDELERRTTLLEQHEELHNQRRRVLYLEGLLDDACEAFRCTRGQLGRFANDGAHALSTIENLARHRLGVPAHQVTVPDDSTCALLRVFQLFDAVGEQLGMVPDQTTTWQIVSELTRLNLPQGFTALREAVLPHVGRPLDETPRALQLELVGIFEALQALGAAFDLPPDAGAWDVIRALRDLDLRKLAGDAQ